GVDNTTPLWTELDEKDASVIFRLTAGDEAALRQTLHDLIARLRRDSRPARDLSTRQTRHALQHEQHGVLRVADAVLPELLTQLRLIGPRHMAQHVPQRRIGTDGRRSEKPA